MSKNHFNHIIAMSGSVKPKLPSKGMVLWEGKSPANGMNIVAVITYNSANSKTGNMAQLWILNRDTHPSEAVETGEDSAVCGGCPLRHHNQGACYVMPWREPANVWKSYQKGNYQSLDWEVLKIVGLGKGIRLGAYGDPAMLPVETLALLTQKFDFWTGYTHQWYAPWYDERLNRLLQLSVDEKSIRHARKIHPNAKVFLVTKPDYTGNIPLCPAENFDVKCDTCKTCNGQETDVRITVHGVRRGRL